MATNFVDIIATSLENWDNSATNLEYYQWLSWSGALTGTRYYREKDDTFKLNSASARKAEKGIIDPTDVFTATPRGTNNCQ